MLTQESTFIKDKVQLVVHKAFHLSETFIFAFSNIWFLTKKNIYM